MAIHELPAERDFRGPGCGSNCRAIKAILPGVFGRSELLLHDAEAHEAYGRRSAGPHTDRDLIVTGRLVVDCGRLEALVDGVAAGLTPTELRIVIALARHCGRTVLVHDVIREVWGARWCEALVRDPAHVLRVNMVRVRQKLGAADGLLVTVTGIGYRLELVEAGANAPRLQAAPYYRQRLAGWSRDHERCANCGTTERPHWGHGYCARSRCRREGERVHALR